MMKHILIIFIALASVGTLSAQPQPANLTLDHSKGVVTATWNTDETQILTADEAGDIHIWSANNGDILTTIHLSDSALTHALWLSNNTQILSADESGTVQLISADNGDILHTWHIDGIPIHLELSDDETRIFAFTNTGNGAIWTGNGEDSVTVSRSGTIRGASWSADETQIRTWSEDGRLVAWDATTGERLATFSIPYPSILLGVAFNHDDTRLLAWLADGAVLVYETDGLSINEQSVSRARHNSFVQQAIWASDETSYMSWGADDTIHVRDTESGQSQQMLQHEDWVTGAQWNMSESYIVSWSHIYISIWSDGTRTQQFQHDNLVRGARFNQDATQILSWSWDGTARVWDMPQ